MLGAKHTWTFSPWALIGVVTGVIALGGCGWTMHEAREAKRFCEALVPKIIQVKAQTGRFPDDVDPSWWRGQRVPRLIDTNNFYYVAGYNNTFFQLQFENPYHIFDNITAFDSYTMSWIDSDSNFRRR